MTAGHLHSSYVVIDPCIVSGTICVSVKPAKLLLLPVIRLPSWISSTHRRPTKSEVQLVERLTPKGSSSRWNFDDMFHTLGAITTSG